MNTSFRTALGALVAGTSLLAVTACGGDAGAQDAPANAETISVAHAQGTADVPVNPEKVYTFDLGVLDSLDALGIEADGVPEAVYPESLSKYEDAKFEKIGSMKEPDFDAISNGDPDLIIISGRTAGSYEELSKIAPTIDLTIDAAQPMDSFKEQAATLGTIFDVEDEVADQLKGIEEHVAGVKAKAADAGTGLVLMTSGGEVTAYGAGSRFGIVHDVLGVQTAADVKAEGSHGESVSFEYIKEANPDMLFVIDRDTAVGTAGGASTAVLDNALVNSTSAAKNDKVTQLDPTGWYLVGYGLNNLPKMIGAVAGAL